jgi:ESF2/ABP1 family protein
MAECRPHKKRCLSNGNNITAVESMSGNSEARISAELSLDQQSHSEGVPNAISSNKLSQSRAAIAKTGVVYLSRIPPRLSPTKLRQLLSPYGSKLLRIFLAPESAADFSRRIKSGGSKKRQFIEGWVEFEDKKVARRVAEMLNAQRMGGRKGDFWYDDLWCIKYLPKFKWHHLTEQIGRILVKLLRC